MWETRTNFHFWACRVGGCKPIQCDLPPLKISSHPLQSLRLYGCSTYKKHHRVSSITSRDVICEQNYDRFYMMGVYCVLYNEVHLFKSHLLKDAVQAFLSPFLGRRTIVDFPKPIFLNLSVKVLRSCKSLWFSILMENIAVIGQSLLLEKKMKIESLHMSSGAHRQQSIFDLSFNIKVHICW